MIHCMLLNNDIRDITNDVGFFSSKLSFVFNSYILFVTFKSFCFSFILNLVHIVYVYIIYVLKHNFSLKIKLKIT